MLLELLLGMSVLVITILTIFSLFPMADRSVGHADRAAQANYIARSLMEDRLATPYAELALTSVPEVGEIALQHTQRRGQALTTNFDYTISVTHPYADRQLKRVVVTVGWERGSQDALETVRLECDKGSLW